jgi:uncharacterized protein with PIN domain
LPERTTDLHDHFMRCTTCARVYWKGSHYRRMQALVEDIKREALAAERSECS